jgi:uncharacterized protein (DUF2141 family)
VTVFLRAALGLCLLVPAFSAGAAELRVSVNGLQAVTGSVMIGLYDSRKTFEHAIELADKEGIMNDPNRVAGIAMRANAQRSASVVFTNLVPGRYAIILFHDENGNGHLDKNFWGVPLEPYGFSNDAQGILGPPSFADAGFDLAEADRAMTISLIRHASVVAGSVKFEEKAEAVPTAATELAK